VLVYESENTVIKRTLEPVRYFSDLQAQAESFNPGYDVIMSLPDGAGVVGSQFELLCAYQDGMGDCLTLDLKLIVQEKKKRHLDVSDDESDDGGELLSLLQPLQY